MLKAVKKEKIFQEIVRQIHHLIQIGKLKAGDKLPPERDLAQIFKVSRASVREAIRVLESAGLVTSRIGDGTYVETDLVENLVEPLATVITGGRESLIEIFAIRKMIEPQIAFLAAERATDEDIVELTRLLEQQRSESGNGQSITEIDYSFHLQVAQTARSVVYLTLYTTLAEMINQTRAEYLQEGDRPNRSLNGHQEILEALRSRDPIQARKAMTSHLRTIEREALKEHMDKD
jgi:GntR family transcriptional repressor for pyruvate dehydrogenase complex